MDAPHIPAPDPNKQPKLSARASLYFKGAVVLFLVIFTTIIAACGAPDNSMSATEKPQVTVTIDPNHIQKQVTASPTPGYWCGAWATQTSPAYNADAQQLTLGINAKFTKITEATPRASRALRPQPLSTGATAQPAMPAAQPPATDSSLFLSPPPDTRVRLVVPLSSRLTLQDPTAHTARSDRIARPSLA